MSQRTPLLAIYYGWREPRRYAVRYRVGYSHERIDIYHLQSLRDLISHMLKRVADIDPELLAKLDEADDKEFTKSAHRKRRYFAKHRDTLYLQAGHLQRHSMKVGDYWLATNIGAQEIRSIVRSLADAAEVPLAALSKAVP
ncbi:MAG: hypothetical protein LC114_05760 [Bryobacterales bacterium]|nr:hypothetical protein [Bryobacterales bacterium]